MEECKTGLKEQVPEVVEIGAAEFLVRLGKGGELVELWAEQVPNLCSATCPNTAVSSGEKEVLSAPQGDWRSSHLGFSEASHSISQEKLAAQGLFSG